MISMTDPRETDHNPGRSHRLPEAIGRAAYTYDR